MGWLAKLFGRTAAADGPSRNDRVRQQLLTYGDDGRRPRHVVHYAYPIDGRPGDDAGQIIDLLTGQGYQARPAQTNDGVVFEHHAAVAGPAFDARTRNLTDDLARRGWDYDGWECAVVEQK